MKLKAIRDRTGKTQSQIAKEVGMTERGYRAIEAKHTYKPVQNAIRIAKALNSTVEELFGETQSQPDNMPNLRDS